MFFYLSVSDCNKKYMDVYGLILIIYLSSYVPAFATNKDEEEILCVYMKSCVLTCRFTPGSDLYIRWTKTDGDLIVHSFHHDPNQVLDQYPDYRGRTSLFEEEMNRGNASLLLRNVTVEDEGRFLCLANGQHTYVNMTVFAPVSQVHVYSNDGHLYCEAHHICPKPSLNWTMNPEPSAEPQTVVNPSETGLFSVHSFVPRPDPPYKYICTVSTEHSTNSTKSTKSTTYEETEPTSVYSPLVWGITCLIAVLAVWFCYKWCKKRNRFQVKSSRKNEPSSDADVEEHLRPNN